MTMALNDRLNALRDSIKALKVNGFLVPTQDAFLSEYPPSSAQRLAWLSGFDGSAGTALVLAEAVDDKPAVLFTDGRYTLQAASQLDESKWHIVDTAESSPAAWLAEHQPDATLGFDAWLHSHAQVAGWGGVRTQALETNPIDALWVDRPPEPVEPAFAHPMRYAGESSQSKRERVISAMEPAADAVLLTLPDGINWLLNIRGSDIPYNPLVLCYALLDRSGQVTVISHARDWPALDGVQHVPLEAFRNDPKDYLKEYKHLQLDSQVTVEALWQAANEVSELIEVRDPTLPLKAIKNDVEMAGMRAAHQRDGRALSHFIQWLDSQSSCTELDAVAKLQQFRQAEASELYRGSSFETISGSGPNGAIVHYRVTPDTNRAMQDGELYLVDSGAQYPDGTTDVTRTIALGTPTLEMIDRYTRVLKGHIAIARAVFPEGTPGSQLDALARQYLWEIGEDYAHGTGHGVGSYLCVHEGPQRISRRSGDVALEAGMVLSNEPGYYKTGEYGIRIENLVLVVAGPEPGFLAFETLTLAPMDERLIDRAMLTADEAAWLDDYHARVSANLT